MPFFYPVTNASSDLHRRQALEKAPNRKLHISWANDIVAIPAIVGVEVSGILVGDSALVSNVIQRELRVPIVRAIAENNVSHAEVPLSLSRGVSRSSLS